MTTGTTAPAPLSEADQIIAKIGDLQQRLQSVAPGYEGLLHEIHVALHKNENVVHLLTDDQIGIIVAGLSLRKGIVLAEVDKGGRPNKKLAGGKKLSETTLDDL